MYLLATWLRKEKKERLSCSTAVDPFVSAEVVGGEVLLRVALRHAALLFGPLKALSCLYSSLLQRITSEVTHVRPHHRPSYMMTRGNSAEKLLKGRRSAR